MKKNCCNRVESRLLKKQLILFEKRFSSFSLFQLETIRDLINDIIERKKSYGK